jgi:mRNA-degrading endonuclease HigB of HigAB toxin-antitoxin module
MLNVLISMESNGKSNGIINSTRKLYNLAKNADLNKPEEVKALIATTFILATAQLLIEKSGRDSKCLSAVVYLERGSYC